MTKVSDLNNADRSKLRKMLTEVEGLMGRVEELSADLGERLDNVTEHFPDSERVANLEEQVEHLDTGVWMALDDTKTALNEALEM